MVRWGPGRCCQVFPGIAIAPLTRSFSAKCLVLPPWALPPPTTLVIIRLGWWWWYLIGFLSDPSNRKSVIIITQTKCPIYRTLGKLGLQTVSPFQEYQTQSQGSLMRLMKNRKKRGYDGDDNDDDDNDDDGWKDSGRVTGSFAGRLHLSHLLLSHKPNPILSRNLSGFRQFLFCFSF